MRNNQQFFEQQLSQSLKFGFIHNVNYQNNLYAPKIIVNNPEKGQHVLTELQEELSKCTSFHINVAFITQTGVAMLKAHLLELAERGGNGRIMISPYLGFNDPRAMRELLKLKNVKVRLAKEEVKSHAKIYLFDHPLQQVVIAGSSNLTHSALKTNYEWNIKLTSTDNGEFIQETRREYDRMWRLAVPLTEDIIRKYQATRTPFLPTEKVEDSSAEIENKVFPNKMQQEAIEGLQTIREEGKNRALVISATGTGKTYLSAFDVQQYRPKKLLFVVHREQILNKARQDYQEVIGFDWEESCVYRSGMDLKDKRYVFATVQSISRDENLINLASDLFDYILIDEVHKAGADSYRKLMNHFEPNFILGMTATPERTDGQNIYELFDYNIAYEIRLQAALEADMLCPFLYFGVSEIEYEGRLLDEKTMITSLTSDDRINHILEKTNYYGVSGSKVCGLMFCSRNAEAKELSRKLNERGLTTVALSGKDSPEIRQNAVKALEEGELDYILTVDIFNEGIDIPAINQVVLLRNTESSIIFIQQLGRGLRKHPSKEHVTIIDFIGNYRNNFLIPIALYGDTSMNKDNYRRKMAQSHQLNGVSTINFEEVAQQQIFSSIKNTTLSNISNLRIAFEDTRNRLGRTPYLIDYINQNNLDPSVFFENSAFKHYGDVIRRFTGNSEGIQLNNYAERILRFLTVELLNGKRPHELVILTLLINQKGLLTQAEVLETFEQYGISTTENYYHSAINLLKLTFFNKNDIKKYGGELVFDETDGLKLSEQFEEALENADFAKLVKDIIRTGLRKSRTYQAGYTQYPLQVGAKYSRKDVCRLLLWDKDESSTIYGYKTKHQTCPIFVTYHKSDDISETTQYGDVFFNERVFHWYTRSNRTLASAEVDKIIRSQELGIALHLFVKKEDGEGTDFYYLGEVRPQPGSEVETIMNQKDSTVPVVTMNLELEQAVSYDLFHYLIDY